MTAVGTAPGQVAGTVQTAAAAERVGQEAFGAQTGAMVIAARQGRYRPIYSSPATPAGCGFRSRSRMWI
nr:hypothetical protein [Methylosarcina fibrata]